MGEYPRRDASERRFAVRSLALLALLLASTCAWADWSVDLETGVARNPYNTFRVPATSGTQVDLHRGFDVPDITFQRWRVTYETSDHEQWSLLYAPLTFRGTGVPTTDVNFNGATFAAGQPLSGSYSFNSYRLTWRKLKHTERDFTYGWGVTAKIRDAAIELSNSSTTSRNSNVGFVPLINLYGRWKMGEHWSAVFEADALVGAQGRAEDVSLSLNYKVNDTLTARLGYRIVEGGVDVDQVYNFATVDYISFGVTAEF